MNIEGKVLLQFYMKVKVESAVHVEILAFRERILVAAASHWFQSHSFVFELNAKSVVVWSRILHRHRGGSNIMSMSDVICLGLKLSNR